MPNYTHLTAIGHMTRDPEIKQLKNVSVTEFDLAVNEKLGKNNDTCFLKCSCFGKTGETIAKYFKKGDPVLIEGKLQQQSWQDKSGNKQSKYVVLVNGFSFVGNGQSNNQNDRPKSPKAETKYDEDNRNDDVPF